MGLDEHSGPKKQKPYNSYLNYGSLAIQMVVTIGVAAWAGHQADLYFKFKFPVFLLGLVMTAFGGIMYKLYQSITKE